MGGSAFQNMKVDGQSPLQTPRLQPSDYRRLKALYTNLLRHHFANAEVLNIPERPEKRDYGDVDIYIATTDTIDWKQLAAKLGAAGLIDRGGVKSQKCSLAVRVDGRFGLGPLTKSALTQDKPHTYSLSVQPEETYAQIDIDIIDPARAKWFTFYASYGDLAILLGYIVKEAGFTVNDKGFWLRLQELDAPKDLPNYTVTWAEGAILLCYNPDHVMAFLGLSAQDYHRGFSTLDSFYAWLAKGRFLMERACQRFNSRPVDKKNDRKHEALARFFGGWLYWHPEALDPCPCNDLMTDECDSTYPSSSSPPTTIDQPVQPYDSDGCDLSNVCPRCEALKFFNKREEDSRKHRFLDVKRRNEQAIHLLRPMVETHSGKSGKQVTEILRAFRRNVHVSPLDWHYIRVLQTPHCDELSELHRLLDVEGKVFKEPGKVDAFVKEHWEQIRAREREHIKTREREMDVNAFGGMMEF